MATTKLIHPFTQSLQMSLFSKSETFKIEATDASARWLYAKKLVTYDDRSKKRFTQVGNTQSTTVTLPACLRHHNPWGYDSVATENVVIAVQAGMKDVEDCGYLA